MVPQVGEHDLSHHDVIRVSGPDIEVLYAERCDGTIQAYRWLGPHDLPFLYADARASRIYGGANEIMKLIIARAL